MKSVQRSAVCHSGLCSSFMVQRDSLEMKNMIPAAKERLNLSKEEKWAKDMMPVMMPAKHDIAERIIKALVAFQYAGGETQSPFFPSHPSSATLHPLRGRTYTVGLHVALVGHAVAPQALVGVAAGQAVLHPVVGGGGDYQQDVADDRAEEAPSHEAVHPELERRRFCRATVTVAYRQGESDFTNCVWCSLHIRS